MTDELAMKLTGCATPIDIGDAGEATPAAPTRPALRQLAFAELLAEASAAATGCPDHHWLA